MLHNIKIPYFYNNKMVLYQCKNRQTDVWKEIRVQKLYVEKVAFQISRERKFFFHKRVLRELINYLKKIPQNK